jgi:ABC-type antimicrobial peptide transport system permease subunit
MPVKYAIKHVFRSWHLFVALLIGITLATTFFAAIDVKANLSAQQALDQQLKNITVDMQFQAPLNSTNFRYAISNISSISGVKSVDEVARFHLPLTLPSDNYSQPLSTNVVSFPDNSPLYNEMLNRPVYGIGENQTYVLMGTDLAKRVLLGDNITTMLSFQNPKYYNTTRVVMNLTVAGFIEFTDKGYALVSGSGGIVYSSPISVAGPNGGIVYNGGYSNYRASMMVIGWGNTLQKLWDNNTYATVDSTFLINVDRKQLISPWNIAESITNVQTVADNIQNNAMGNFLAHGYVDNRLGSSLNQFQYSFSNTLLSFVIVSIPVFFVAWYLGSTVSDVSFNMRRREIGLLSTKGLSSGQIQRMFLTEALAIGVIGGILGVVGGLILNQYFAGGIQLNNLFNPQLYSPTIMIITVAFGVILALTSVFWSARKAARLPAVDALRNYFPADSIKHRKILPIIALTLGSYKLITILLGINIQQVLAQNVSGGAFYLSIVALPLVFLDVFLTYVGPFLFFWGITKLLIRDTYWFQRLTAKISSFMGDLGALAAKNVRRNPARLAAIAFLVALIIGYGVQVNGQIASTQDYTLRSIKSQVGADLTVSVVNASNAPAIMDYILANVSGVQNASLQYQMSQQYLNTVIKVIDPGNWSTTAYYEDSWFSGNSVPDAMKEMTSNNETIILESRVAKQLNLKLYDHVTIDFASCARSLKIVGFFGQQPSTSNSNPARGIYSYTPPTWSYVPINNFNFTAGSPLYTLESFDPTTILVKLEPGTNGTQVAENIRNLGLEIYGVDSFDEQWLQSQSRNNSNTFGSLQVLDIEGLGIVFAVLSASVGTALIAIVSLRERSREATLMSVKGLSYRQLVWMFLVESMAVITFAVILGLTVGLIMLYGTMNTTNVNLIQLVNQRLVFPPQFVATIATYIVLIYASTIGAIVIMTTKYVTKLEKMVRVR